MKLSDAQQKIYDHVRQQVLEARSCSTVEEYFVKYLAFNKNSSFNTPEKYKARDPMGWKCETEIYEKRKAGFALTCCHGATIKKLESLGLIEIINDSTGTTCGIDTVKVLNI